MKAFHRIVAGMLLLALLLPPTVAGQGQEPLDRPEVTGPSGGFEAGLVTRITPRREAVVYTRRPVIEAHFSHWRRGIAGARIRMWVNGQEVRPQIRTASMVQYRPQQRLPLGRTGVQIHVFDRGGMRASVLWAFTIQRRGGGGGGDEQGPIVTSLSPSREARVPDRQPVISVTFTDRGTGVDPDRTRLWVNGQEVRPQLRTQRMIQYRPPRPLNSSRTGVQVWVFDRLGNRTDVLWAFTIVAR
jgi:hypothetical protein